LSKHLKAHLAALTVNLIYGANFTISKSVMPTYIQPSGFILLRVAFALCCFALFHRLFVPSEKVEKKDYFRFFLCGLFGVAINQLLFFEGLARTTTINAALIMTSNPVLVLVAAVFMLHEKITVRKIVGIALGIAGAALLILRSDTVNMGSSTWKGDVMILINAASYAIFLVMAKPLMTKYNPFRVITWTFVFGLVLVIPFGSHELSQVQWHLFSGKVWLAVLYVCFFSTFMVYLLSTYGLKHLSPAVVSFYIYAQPLFATLISLVITGEEVTWLQGIACLLIFTGVYLVSNRTVAVAKS
jgi:drug/metabolite transporter (DMT)-like permease